MLRLLSATALIAATVGQPLFPAQAKGPKPAPVGECRPDISGRTICAYYSQRECLSAARAFNREYDVQGCYLSTADPTYWHYGKWILLYS